jgi:hypothetical protein
MVPIIRFELEQCMIAITRLAAVMFGPCSDALAYKYGYPPVGIRSIVIRIRSWFASLSD